MMTPTAPMTAIISVFKFSSGCVTAEVPVPAAKQTEEAANTINETKRNGGRVICVGTTSCRTVESAADEQGMVQPGCDNTEIFIYPGYRFKVLDALITNFHLPESTLVMLVSALAGREHILHAYEEAIHEKYRFFSFGDAMFIADLKGEK